MTIAPRNRIRKDSEAVPGLRDEASIHANPRPIFMRFPCRTSLGPRPETGGLRLMSKTATSQLTSEPETMKKYQNSSILATFR